MSCFIIYQNPAKHPNSVIVYYISVLFDPRDGQINIANVASKLEDRLSEKPSLAAV
jgi:hypothetical protein